MTHHQHVGLRQRVTEKIAGLKFEATFQAEGAHIVLIDGLDLRQIEGTAGEVFVRQCHLDRKATLRSASGSVPQKGYRRAGEGAGLAAIMR